MSNEDFRHENFALAVSNIFETLAIGENCSNFISYESCSMTSGNEILFVQNRGYQDPKSTSCMKSKGQTWAFLREGLILVKGNNIEGHCG
jgi:hypothetical protein